MAFARVRMGRVRNLCSPEARRIETANETGNTRTAIGMWPIT
jgi:hypothetical protein